jgi:surfeit locus 1 family protein
VILIAGFIGAFGALFSMFAWGWPVWLLLLVWLPVTLVLSLGLMRPAKGLMVAAQSPTRPRKPVAAMSETFPAKKAGFPIGLTIATAIAFAILCFLGAWQMQRLAWKQDLLARIETLKTAPPVPLATVLTGPATAEDAAWRRVSVDCRSVGLPPLPWPTASARATLSGGPRRCAGSGQGPYNLILVDRGVVPDLTGKVDTPSRAFAEPGHVVGVLIPLTQMGGDRAKAVAGIAGRTPRPGPDGRA